MRKLLIAIAGTVAVSSAHAESVEHDATAVYALPSRAAAGFECSWATTIRELMRAGSASRSISQCPSEQRYSRHAIEPGSTRGDYVWVRHRDGTVASYLHLRHNGAAVKVGQAVKAGQLLGYSGCTGHCRAGLLHFHVATPLQSRYASNGFKTFPTVFKTTKGVEFLEPNRSYQVP